MALRVTTAPTAKVVSIDLAKTHCRVTHEHDNDYLELLIESAGEVIGELLSRTWITTIYEKDFHGFPDGQFIELPRSPAASVQSIKYQDEDDEEQTLASSVYGTFFEDLVSTVFLKQGQSWPATRAGELGTVTIQFTAGYGTAQTDVPANARLAILMAVLHAYLNRSPYVTGATVSEIGDTMKFLLSTLGVPKV